MIRISIVEDIPEVLDSLRTRIEQEADMTCVGAYPMAEEALTGLTAYPPDIVLMDIGLPAMGGIECMLRVKLKHPQVRFLMFTVFDNDEKVFESLKSGASGYVLKREGTEGAIQAIRNLHAGGAPMSRDIARKVLESFHAKGPANPLTETLTPREIEILQLLSRGLLYKEIALRLSPPIAEGTVRQHIHHIYRKLEVNNRTEAINRYLGLG